MFRRKGNRRQADNEAPELAAVPPHESFFEDLRPKDWTILTGLVAVVLGLIIWEASNPEVGKFLSSHPLLTAMGTAFLLSLIAIGGLDALRAHWEAERWRKLSSLAMLSIAYDVTRVRDVFIWLVIGIKPISSFTRSSEVQEELNSLRKSEGLSETHDADYGKVQYVDYAPMLKCLADNQIWQPLANVEIDRVKAYHRKCLALWVPSMILHPNTTRVLARVVELNESLSEIQGTLSDRHRNRTLESHEILVTSWTGLLAEATSLREDLWAASRGCRADHDSRKILPLGIQREMERRDQDAIFKVVAKPLRVSDR